nr:immunoglobulin light chain junction region [Macaca mulatta]
FMQALQTPFTF